MAKGTNETRRPHGVSKATSAAGAPPMDELERRVVEFFEQLGRIAGTVQVRVEGWMDRQKLTEQIAGVRDAAANLLERIADDAAEASNTIPDAVAALGTTRGRSGGVVDAPGKKHRKPLPADPGAKQAAVQATKMRAARTMVKTNKRRGRG